MTNKIYDRSGTLVQRTITDGNWEIIQRRQVDGSWWNISIKHASR